MITPATTNWVIPEGKDLLEVLSAEILAKADGNVTADAQPYDPAQPYGTATLRSTLVLSKVVAKVRAAIRNAGHTALSVTAGAIPIEAYDHVLNMAAWKIVNSSANIQMYVVTEKGAYSPLGEMNKQAEEWLNGTLQNGRRVGGLATQGFTPPTDPTGRDWATAITWMEDKDEYTDEELASLTWTWDEFQALGYTFDEWNALDNPPILGTVRFGSTGPEADMNSDSMLSVAPDVEAKDGGYV